MTLYLGENLISGQATLVGESRNIGQIIPSTIPLTDAGLHILDGALINGSGIYSDFVDYIAELYENIQVSGYKYNITTIGSPTNNNGVLSGFSASNYAEIPNGRQNDNAEYVVKFTTSSDVTTSQVIFHSENLVCIEVKNNYCVYYDWGAKSIKNLFTVNADSTYWVKVLVNGNVKTYSYSTDGNIFNEVLSFTDTGVNISASYPARFGNNSNDSYLTTMFLGTIDLNECYININGERWWGGAEATKPCFCTEEQWQTSITTYGVCGKFVYDDVNNTVRLPKITGIVEGTTDLTALGDLVEAGLPNITGTFYNSNYKQMHNGSSPYASSSGAFTNTNQGGTGGSNWGANGGVFTFNASRSSDVYGKSSTVQPQTIKVLYYIVIATSTKTDIEVDIDQVTTDINQIVTDLSGKANTDLTNVPNSKAILTESYVNGTSWYRVYSDGWCEQGGCIQSPTNGNNNISFIKPFVDTTYYFNRINYSTVNGTATNFASEGYSNKTNSGIRIYLLTNYAGTIYWEAKGYIS